MHFKQSPILVFGEINLDINIHLAVPPVINKDTVIPSTIKLLSGGNTWNIARLLALLERQVTFLCTASETDIPASLVKNEDNYPNLNVIWIPGLNTIAPRFLSVDVGPQSWLKTVYIPSQQMLDSEQYSQVVREIDNAANRSTKLGILASSIESGLLAHLIELCVEKGIKLIATVSSEPSARQYTPHLGSISLLITNRAEAYSIAGMNGPDNQQESEFGDNDLRVGRKLAEQAEHVVMTLGPQGSILFTKTATEPTFCHTVDLGLAFVSALGAGDAFATFLIKSLVDENTSPNLEMLEYATAGALLTCKTQDHLLRDIENDKLEAILRNVKKKNVKFL